MKKLIVIALIFFGCLVSTFCIAQSADSTIAFNDSISKERASKKHTYSAARRASLMSAVLPGLGQAVNKKYWKIPLIYGAFGGLAYMFVSNNDSYQFFRKNHIAEADGDSNTVNTTFYSATELQTQKQYYQKNRNFAVIGIGLVYLLNIIDANVDAHLKTFDVSDDLSLNIDPWQTIFKTQLGYRNVTGISVKINFK